MLSIKEYAAISADVWGVFKKYLPSGVSLDDFTDDVHVLDEKYHAAGDLNAYRFMQKLLKVYFDELGRVKNEQADQDKP